MYNKIVIIFLLALLSNFNSQAQTSFEKGYYDGFSKGYCFDGSRGCEVPEITAPKPSLIESESSYEDGFQKGFDNGYEKYEIRKRGSDSYSDQKSSFSRSDDFSVPLSMQNNTYDVDLKQYEPKFDKRVYFPEFDDFNKSTEDVIKSFKEDLQKFPERVIPRSSISNQDLSVHDNNSTNRYIQNEKDKRFVIVFLLSIFVILFSYFMFRNGRNVLWIVQDAVYFLKPYYGLFIISSLITHIWTVIIAFSESGLLGGIISLILPGISEIYWMVKMFGENDLYAYISLIQLILAIPMTALKSDR